MVDPPPGRHAVVELRGDPRRPQRTILGVDRADTLRQVGVRRLAGGAGGLGIQPGIERGTGDLDDLAQPLHLEGVPVVGNELETAHQIVSPAKYFAA